MKNPDSFFFLSFCSAVLSQQLMIMEMFIINLVNRILYRRKYDTLPPEADDEDHITKVSLEAAVVEHDV